MAGAAKSAKTAEAGLGVDTRVLVLYGSEEMLKREHFESLRTALTAVHGDLQISMFGGETDSIGEVLDELRTYSLAQQYKLVVVDDADELIKASEEDETPVVKRARGKKGRVVAPASRREMMERYAQGPMEGATLVLRCSEWRKGNLDKHILKVGAIIKCEPLRPDAARAWVMKRAKSQHGTAIEPEAAKMMVDRLGVNLMQLDAELGKAALVVPAGEAIDEKTVASVVGRSSDEKAWAVQEAMLAAMDPSTLATPAHRAREMLGKIHDLVDLSGQDEVPISFAIADLMRKLTLGAILKAQGLGGFGLTREVGVWGPGQDAFLAIVAKVDPRKTAKWFDRIVELERRSRSGLGTPLRNLECFCAQLADEL